MCTRHVDSIWQLVMVGEYRGNILAEGTGSPWDILSLLLLSLRFELLYPNLRVKAIWGQIALASPQDPSLPLGFPLASRSLLALSSDDHSSLFSSSGLNLSST